MQMMFFGLALKLNCSYLSYGLIVLIVCSGPEYTVISWFKMHPEL